MQCDSTHSLIERKIRNKQIKLPSQLADLIRNARKAPTPLQVHHLTNEYFLDYESVPKLYSSIGPGKVKKLGDPTVNMLRVLAYDPSGIIYFKVDVTDDYKELPQRIGIKLKAFEPLKLHLKRIKISSKKWQHLQDLKPFLPPDCHSFYNEIPFEM